MSKRKIRKNPKSKRLWYITSKKEWMNLKDKEAKRKQKNDNNNK